MGDLVHSHEAERLDRLRSYAQIGVPPDPRLDELVSLAAYVCRAPIAMLNLVDADRVWVRARAGVEVCEVPREAMMCSHTVDGRLPLIIPDLTKDARFADTLFVVGEPRVRFYAGAPLLTEDDYAIGTLCVLDTQPRTIDQEQIAALQTLARQAMAWLELHRTTLTLQTVFEQTADGIVIADERGGTLLNPTARELLGPDGAQTGIDDLPTGTSADGQPLSQSETPLARAMRGEVVRDVRWSLPGARGARILDASASPLRRMDGSGAGAVLIVRDQTARAHVEEAVAESRDDVLMLLDSTGEGIYGIDQHGRCTFVNPSALRLLGYDSAEELLGNDMHAVVHDHQGGDPHECPIHGSGCATHLPDATMRRRDGSTLAVEVWSSPVFRRGAVVGCVVTFVDVSDRRRVEQERERALSEAHEAVHARDEFLSIAAHELRTPVTALQLQAQSLRRHSGDAVSRPVAERIDQLLGQGERLANLINQLLDVSRISRGRLELEAEDVELRGLVFDVVARYAAQAKRSGCTVTIDAPTEVHGRWDRGRLEQVVTNLLSNAMKYGRGRPILITVHAPQGRSKAVALSVHDQGIGISAEDQKRIFERFERAAPTKTFGGLGLGLFIVRQIVEASGGCVEVESTFGEGSTFTVRLPPGPAAAPRP